MNLNAVITRGCWEVEKTPTKFCPKFWENKKKSEAKQEDTMNNSWKYKQIMEQLTYDPWAGEVSSETLNVERKVNENGYVVLKIRGMELLEHRVAMALNGEDIKGKHVHHINRARYDNRYKNLILLEPEEHKELHREEKENGEFLDPKERWIRGKTESEIEKELPEGFESKNGEGIQGYYPSKLDQEITENGYKFDRR